MHEADLISRDLLNTLKRRASAEVRQELSRLKTENKQLWATRAVVTRRDAEVRKLKATLQSQELVVKTILDQYRLLQKRLDTKISYRLRDALKMNSGFQWYTAAGRALRRLQKSK